jgi:hypothetical protein
VGIGGYRNILGGGYLRAAVRQKIHGYATSEITKLRKLVPPQITIEQHAMHEQCHRTVAVLKVADAS